MSEHSSRSADVLVIGGGIIGCSIAWRLAQAGMKVTLLDRSEPGGEASAAAGGMLAPLGEVLQPRTFSELCIASRNLYPRFAAEVEECSGHLSGYRSDGSLMVAFDEKLEEELTAIHRSQTAQGYTLHSLTGDQIRDCGSVLSQHIRSGLFIPDDHWIDNERLMKALLIACHRAGVRIESGCAVHKFNTRGTHIDGLDAGNDARFAAKTYVLAAGCWSGKVAEAFGVYLPMAPCCGQMMEFEVKRELPFVVRSGMHYLVPRPGRRLLAGTTSEYAGFDKTVTAKGLLSILEGAVRFAPMLGEARFLRAWAGLRPDTSDHLPILGYGVLENLIFATGHFRNGILLAPITAEIVSDLIAKGSTSRPVEAYRPTRFKIPDDQVIRIPDDPLIR
jgi:glycine oxidase